MANSTFLEQVAPEVEALQATYADAPLHVPLQAMRDAVKDLIAMRYSGYDGARQLLIKIAALAALVAEKLEQGNG